jgi:hypothetical protein
MIGPAPSLRLDLNVGTSWSLPSWSSGPHGDEQTMLEAARAAGYMGVQGANPRRCRDLGLIPSTFGIHASPGGLLEHARSWADNGFACCTLLLGTGLEDDDGAARLVDEVLHASATAGIPLYVETHRATLTQDAWRTVQLVDRFPELRFNPDFSHWYTGLDLSFGNFEAKLDFLAPVFDRVRYLHGRIGTPGCIQVDVGDGGTDDQPPVAHFRALWARAMTGFLAKVKNDLVVAPNLELGFAPELLPPEAGYAPPRHRPRWRARGGGRSLDPSPRARPHRRRLLCRGGQRHGLRGPWVGGYQWAVTRPDERGTGTGDEVPLW